MEIILNKSKEEYEIAKTFTPGGVHSNVRWMRPHPIYFEKGKGSKIIDVDGNEYIDFLCNYGALILGHGDPDVIRAVEEQLQSGLTSGVETDLSIKVAQKIIEMVPCCEMVRFANSGTEAVMHSIHIARGYTGKNKILKAEGNYHGWYDYVFCSNRYPFKEWVLPNPYPSSLGLSKDIDSNTLVVPYNDIESAEEVIKKYKNEIAAMIIEPVNHNIGCAIPKENYLNYIRELTRNNNILLIFDEVITGFRCAPGGAQEFFGVTPDLATFGKAVANGFPLSIVGGKKDIMEVINPINNKVAYGGTYNGNQATLAAALASLKKLETGEIQKNINKLTDKIIKGFEKIFDQNKIRAKIQGFGGKFQVYFTDNKVFDWRSASVANETLYAKFREGLLNDKILWTYSAFSHPCVTGAHSEDDIDKTLEIANKILKLMKIE